MYFLSGSIAPLFVSMLWVCGGLGRRCVAAQFVSFRLLWSYCRLSVFEHIFYCHQTASFLFAFHWLMRWAFLFLGLAGNLSCFFNGFRSLDPHQLDWSTLELTCRSQVIFFPSFPACFRSPTNSTGKSIVELFVDFCSLLSCILIFLFFLFLFF